jgi:hypothetical protein
MLNLKELKESIKGFTISELLKNHKHGEMVVIGGKITALLPPMSITFTEQDLIDMGIDPPSESLEDEEPKPPTGFMFVDDTIGEVNVILMKKVYDRDKAHLTIGNVVLIKGVVQECQNRDVLGEVIGREFKLLASSIIPLEEEVSTEDGRHQTTEADDAEDGDGA